MKHPLHTITYQAVSEKCDCDKISVARWIHGCPHAVANGIRLSDTSLCFMLPHVVAALRCRGTGRKRGLKGVSLQALVNLDAEIRRKRGFTRPDIAVHSAPDLALTDGETRRWMDVRRRLRGGLVMALWSDAVSVPESIVERAVMHPSILRYVLSNDAAELPTDVSGWTRWAAEFALVNMPRTELHTPERELENE